MRDSVEGWREAVLGLDAFLGWKQVLNRSDSCLMSAWQEWHPAAIAGTITAVFLTVWYTGLMLKEVKSYLYIDCPLSRSQSTDTAGYYWTYSHPGRFHRTKGYSFTRSISKNMNSLSDLGQDLQARVVDEWKGEKAGKGSIESFFKCNFSSFFPRSVTLLSLLAILSPRCPTPWLPWRS